MNSAHRDKHRSHHRKRGHLFRRLKRFFKGLFVGDSAPREYRPYLGPTADEKEVEEKSYENTRVDQGKYLRKRREKRKWLDFSAMADRRARKREERRKRRVKNKIKRKYRRKQRRRARIEFIRRFIPQYKKSEVATPEITHIENVEDKDKDKIKTKGNFIYTINSVVVFIIAYLVVYMIYQITVLVVASRWRLDSVLFYYDLAFNDYSPLWNRTNIILITLSGPLISLIIGMVFMRLIVPRINVHKNLKLLFLWIAFHGYNFFLGAFASGVSFDEGFGYVPAWLYMSTFLKILFSLVFLFILGLIGYYAAPKFLETSYSLVRIRQQNKIKFLFFRAVLPWLLGSIIIYLVKIPNNMNYDTANLVTLAFAMIPILFNRGAKPSKKFTNLKKPSRVRWAIVVLVVAMLLAYRIGLDNGIHVKMYYKFTFTLDVTPLK